MSKKKFVRCINLNEEIMFHRFFTPQEANKRLPLIKKIVSDILDKGAVLRELLPKYEGQELPLEGEMLQLEIEGLMRELKHLGCFYKDWDFKIGLVDFPAIINGEEVFLCWRSDEPQVIWYHGLEDGYAGRTPIPDELLEK